MIDSTIEFRTSLLGRVGYLAMILVMLFPLSFLTIALREGGVSSLFSKNWLVIVCVLFVFCICLFFFLY
jgi:hypothetical protein